MSRSSFIFLKIDNKDSIAPSYTSFIDASIKKIIINLFQFQDQVPNETNNLSCIVTNKIIFDKLTKQLINWK